MGSALLADRADVTLPGDRYALGALHPITQVRLEVEEIFLGMGYSVADGPEIETGFNNFTALNTPDGHPARRSTEPVAHPHQPHASAPCGATRQALPGAPGCRPRHA